MTDLDLGPIRERIEKASQRPWKRGDWKAWASARKRRGTFPIWAHSMDGYSAAVHIAETTHWIVGPEQSYANADLIAHAPTDLANLCTEVESLRAQLKEARAECDRQAVLVTKIMGRVGLMPVLRALKLETTAQGEDRLWKMVEAAATRGAALIERAREGSDGGAV